jgi:hypothetical protein
MPNTSYLIANMRIVHEDGHVLIHVDHKDGGVTQRLTPELARHMASTLLSHAALAQEEDAPCAEPEGPDGDRYQIMQTQDATNPDAVELQTDTCYADGASVWDREGQGLVLVFTTPNGELTVDADWTDLRDWSDYQPDTAKALIDMLKAQALNWAMQHDVFSSTKDLVDDDCTIMVIEWED